MGQKPAPSVKAIYEPMFSPSMTFFRNFREAFRSDPAVGLVPSVSRLNRHMGRLEPSVNSDFQKSFQRFLPVSWKRFRLAPSGEGHMSIRLRTVNAFL